MFKNNKEKIFLGLAIAVVAVLVLASGSLPGNTPVPAEAVSEEILGWLWSDNIGWISLNCNNPQDTQTCADVNYKVQLSNTKELYGYAWSDNIGWINFGPVPGGGPRTGIGAPEAPDQWPEINPTRTAINGWVQAIAGNDYADGWDGWIKFTDVSVTENGPGLFFNGFAWGSDVVGWLSFHSVASTNPPCVGCSSTDPYIAFYTEPSVVSVPAGCKTGGGAECDAILKWYVLNVDAGSCYPSTDNPPHADWNDGSSLPQSPATQPLLIPGPITQTVSVDRDTRFYLTCKKDGADVSSNLFISVDAPFTLSANPSSNSIADWIPGVTDDPSTFVYEIEVGDYSQFPSGDITLSVESITPSHPDFVSSFDDSVLTIPGELTTNFNLDVTESVPDGTYDIVIKGTGGGDSATVPVTFTKGSLATPTDPTDIDIIYE